MTKKNIFPVVATIAVVGVVLGVFSMTVMRDSNVSISTMTSEQAYANLSSKMKRIGVQEVKVNPQQLDVSEFLDAKDELPDIESSYPFVVVGNGDVNIEIFSSGEKAAESGSDSFLTSMAKKFNAQHNKTSGDKTMSVSLRSIPSGTAAEYISTGKYQPECYTPSNTLFGELVKNEGVELTVEADRLVGNVAGILVSKKTGDMLRSEYGEASVSSVLNATIDGKLMMGYSNPYTSATGLNFLLAALASSGSDTIVDTAAVENFQKFQANVPLVSFTTQQMVQSADKGIVDGVVMEYQSYQNDPTLQRNYEFIPFGVRHDNPLYSIGNVSAEKKEVIAAFVSFCAQNQAEATKDGFNGLDDYAYTGKAYDGNTIAQAQSVWKEEKDSGIPIVAEFVVDTSGSMRGEPLNALKTAMINTIQYINDDNYIGIIGFDSDVREYLPIDQFSLTQKTLYKGAVNSLDANGSTAMYNGLCVAMDRIYQKSQELGGNCTPIIFVLTDGDNNTGYGFSDTKNIIAGMDIPIYTISYDYNGMFVHVEFDEKEKTTAFGIVLVGPAKGSHDDFTFLTLPAWAKENQSLTEATRSTKEYLEKAAGQRQVNGISVPAVMEAVPSVFDGGTPYVRLAILCANYLASKNPDVRLETSKKRDRPVFVFQGKAQRINVKTYTVGENAAKEYKKNGEGKTPRWRHYWCGNGRERRECKFIY